MKAPRLVLALGLSIPILVQGFSPHPQDESLDAASEYTSPDEFAGHAGNLEPRGVDKEAGVNDVDLDHGIQQGGIPVPLDWPTSFTQASKPHPQHTRLPHVEERGIANDDNDSHKTRCNPFAPFCSHAMHNTDASESNAEALVKRKPDTPDSWEEQETEHGKGDDSDSTDDEYDMGDFDMMRTLINKWLKSDEYDDKIGANREEWIANALKCTMLARECEESKAPCACELAQRCVKYSKINATTRDEVNKCLRPGPNHGKRGDKLDGPPTGAVPETESPQELKRQFQCVLLDAACGTGEQPCACNLLQRCDGSHTTSISNRELNACFLGDGPHPDVNMIELAGDGLLRCAISSQLCSMSGKPDTCGCEAQQKCLSDNSTPPDWSELEQCYSEMGAQGKVPQLYKRDDDEFIAASEDCSHAMNLCQQGSQCACYFSQRCHVEKGLSGRSISLMRTCIDAGRRISRRIERASPTILDPLARPGDKTTVEMMGVTVAMSVSKISPTVIVATGRSGKHHLTEVDSFVQDDPAIMAATGKQDGEEFVYTISVPEKRDAVPSESGQIWHRSFARTVLRPDGALATAGVDIDALRKVESATYGDEDQSGTLVISAVKTNPASVAVSMAWKDEILTATTVNSKSVHALLEQLDRSATNLMNDYRSGKSPGSIHASPVSDSHDRGRHPPRDETETTSSASTSTTTVALVGNMSAPYFRTTDAQGKPIYVTKTGHFAASTTTLIFSESVEPASTTRTGGNAKYMTESGRIAEYTTITKTVHAASVCTPYSRTLQPDKTVVRLAGGEASIKSGLHVINGKTMYVKLADPEPRTTLAPLAPGVYTTDRAPTTYPSVTQLNKTLASKYVARVFEINGEAYTMTNTSRNIQGTPVVMHPLANFMDYDAYTHRVAPTPNCEINHGLWRVVHGWGKRECEIEKCMWNNMRPMPIHTVFPAAFVDDRCDQSTDYFTQRTYLEEPHWGTTHESATYYPAVITRATSSATTTKTHNGTAYVHHYPTCVAKNLYPKDYNGRHHLDDWQDDLPCFDMHSCHQHCARQHGGFPMAVLFLLIGIPLIFGLLIFILLFCCLPGWLVHRRRRQRETQGLLTASDEKERRPSVMDTLRRKSNAQNGAVVNAVTGQATDPATGRAVEGGPGVGTALLAGSTAGAAAAAAGSGAGGGSGSGSDGKGGQGGSSASGAGGNSASDPSSAAGAAGATGAAAAQPMTKVIGGGANNSDDGKGSLGRQAEEGRSRVHFGDNNAGSASPQPVPEEHVVSAPPPKTDGAADVSGRESWADVGSMRGRKKSRPEGPGQVNLGF